MLDPVTEGLVHSALAMADHRKMASRSPLVLYVLDRLRESDDEWALVPHRDAELALGCAKGTCWRNLGWLVNHGVLMRGPRPAGRTPYAYAINPAVQGWDLPWRVPPPMRRLQLRSAMAGGMAVTDALRRADRRDLPLGSAARLLPGHRGANPRRSAFAPRSPGVEGAAQRGGRVARIDAAQTRELSTQAVVSDANRAPSPSGQGGGGRLDMSLPGVAAVMVAIRTQTENPKAALWGEPARALELLCATEDHAELVQAVGWADDGWRAPLIVAQLPELLTMVRGRAAAIAAEPVDEVEARRREREAARARGEGWVDQLEELGLEPDAPTEMLAEGPHQAQLARMAAFAISDDPCHNG